MSKIISLDNARNKRDPHMTGNGLCLACQHKWVAVVPVGTQFFECPSCGVDRGVMIKPVEHDGEHYSCGCGNFYMLLTRDRIYCPNCGRDHKGMWD